MRYPTHDEISGALKHGARSGEAPEAHNVIFSVVRNHELARSAIVYSAHEQMKEGASLGEIICSAFSSGLQIGLYIGEARAIAAKKEVKQ